MSDRPTLRYPHVYTGPDGRSTIGEGVLAGFDKESMGGSSGEQFNLPFAEGPMKIMFSVLPADFDGDWHENPRPQWILPTEGGWWVETQDGKRVELRAGDLSFGGDQNTTADADGNKGHRSGTLDGKPCEMMIVQLLDDKYVGAKPGELERHADA